MLCIYPVFEVPEANDSYVFNWLKEQKEALEKGLVTMEDVEMIVAEAEGNIHWYHVSALF